VNRREYLDRFDLDDDEILDDEIDLAYGVEAERLICDRDRLMRREMKTSLFLADFY
jgi:hypothetical protein